MNKIKFRNKEIGFHFVTGNVLSSNKFSETDVSSTGGGGYIGRYGGVVHAPTINSKSTVKHEFWIKTIDGDERPINLIDIDIPLRVGQRVTLILVSREDRDNGYWSVLVNHNAARHWFLLSSRQLSKYLGFSALGCLHLFIFYILAFVLAAICDIIMKTIGVDLYYLNFIFLLIFLFVFGVIYIRHNLATSSFIKQLNSKLEEMAQVSYSNFS